MSIIHLYDAFVVLQIPAANQHTWKALIESYAFLEAKDEADVKTAPNAYKLLSDQADFLTTLFEGALTLVTGRGRTLHLPKGVIPLNRTVVIPYGTTIQGEGQADSWHPSRKCGTIIRSWGGKVGVAAQWTDIVGVGDPNSAINPPTNIGVPHLIKPLLVAGGNNVRLMDLTLDCTPVPRDADKYVADYLANPQMQPNLASYDLRPDFWHCGFFVPSVKRCGINRVNTRGKWLEGAIYLDATWGSNNNTDFNGKTLKDLHTNVITDSAMNEFTINDCFLYGCWGLTVQGTTRASNWFPNRNDWQWGAGGTSDIYVTNSRIGGEGLHVPEDLNNSARPAEIYVGGAFRHDAHVSGIGENGLIVESNPAQGVNFVNCSFRVTSKTPAIGIPPTYMIKLDRSDRITFVNCYGEGKSGPVRFSITPRTGTQIIRLNDRLNALHYVEDVPVTGQEQLVADSENDVIWPLTRKISLLTADGRLHTPNVAAYGTGNRPLSLRSFANSAKGFRDGQINFVYDDGNPIQFGPDPGKLSDDDFGEPPFATLSKDFLDLRDMATIRASNTLIIKAPGLAMRKADDSGNSITLHENAAITATNPITVNAASAELLPPNIMPKVQIHGQLHGESDLGLMRWVQGTVSGELHFAKARSATVGTHTVVAPNDRLGRVSGRGSDGTAFAPAAFIDVHVDGNVTTGSVPGRVSIWTTGIGGTAPEERARWTAAGELKMSASSGGLHTVINAEGQHQLRSYTLNTLPAAAVAGTMIYVHGNNGNIPSGPAYSDGTSWRRFVDGKDVNMPA